MISKRELCKKLNVSPPTLYRYIKSGKIKVKRHPLTGRILIDDSEISNLLKRIDSNV
ncbi:MAG: helix-turn-helix domain-containing protein [Nitrospirae bacterium]|nr:helix-turn-helix domain-containing protein [Nitrospirota bacterium]